MSVNKSCCDMLHHARQESLWVMAALFYTLRNIMRCQQLPAPSPPVTGESEAVLAWRFAFSFCQTEMTFAKNLAEYGWSTCSKAIG